MTTAVAGRTAPFRVSENFVPAPMIAAVLRRLASDPGSSKRTSRYMASLLARIRSLRIYVVRASDRAQAVDLFRKALPGLRDLGVVRADLCRPELLAEGEALAICR